MTLAPFKPSVTISFEKKNADSSVINIFHDTQYSVELPNNIPDKHVAVDFPVTVE